MADEQRPGRQAILGDLQARLAELFRNSPAADIERNVKALMGQAFQRMDLVTRDEFDVHLAQIDSLRARIVDLEKRLARLEEGASERSQ